MPSIQNQLVDFIAGSMSPGSQEFIDDFVENGPIGSHDAACRYLLAVALRNIGPKEFAELTKTSLPVARTLTAWLEDGTKKQRTE